ncbi:hypothetical protein K470DRAFT_258758, partial [Piedraia hortae CBS 480.64]
MSSIFCNCKKSENASVLSPAVGQFFQGERCAQQMAANSRAKRTSSSTTRQSWRGFSRFSATRDSSSAPSSIGHQAPRVKVYSTTPAGRLEGLTRTS